MPRHPPSTRPMSPPTPHPPFQGIHNFRDVGASLNALSPTPILRERLLFRSSRLDSATPSDLTILATTYKIRTVLDLRSASELRKLPPPPPHPWHTIHIDFLSRPVQVRLLQLLPWLGLLLFLLYTLLGLRERRLRLVASSAISPLGLAGLSVLTLRYTHEEMRRCLAVLADPEAYPVLVHCTQGKDRTGVVVIVVEMLLGARAEAIEREYLLSNEGLEEVLEVMVGELRERGLGGEFAVAEEGVVAAVVAELRSVGGVGAYVGRCGVGEKEVETLRAVLAGGL